MCEFVKIFSMRIKERGVDDGDWFAYCLGQAEREAQENGELQAMSVLGSYPDNLSQDMNTDRWV